MVRGPDQHREQLLLHGSEGDCDRSARAHVQGNTTADGSDLGQDGTDSTAFPAPPVHTQDACTAARLVLAHAGARPLDAVDRQYVSNVVPTGCPEARAGVVGWRT